MIFSIVLILCCACSDKSQFEREARSVTNYNQYRKDNLAGNAPNAHKTLLELVQKHPHSEALVDNLVELEFNMGLSQEAIIRAERQLQIHPGYQDLRLRLASLYTRNNQHSKALEQLAVLVAGRKYSPTELGEMDDLKPLLGINEKIIRLPKLDLLNLHSPGSAVVGELLLIEISVSAPLTCEVWLSSEPNADWYSMRSVIVDKHPDKVDVRAQLQLLEIGSRSLELKIGCGDHLSIDTSSQISILDFGGSLEIDCISPLVIPKLNNSKTVSQKASNINIVRRESGRLKLQQQMSCEELKRHNDELQSKR